MIIRFIKNTVISLKWFRRSWGQRDWDYGYLLDLMAYKIKDLDKYLSRILEEYPKQKDSDYTNFNKAFYVAAQRLRTCNNLLQRAINYDYKNKYYCYCREKKQRDPYDRDTNLALKIIMRYHRYWWD